MLISTSVICLLIRACFTGAGMITKPLHFQYLSNLDEMPSYLGGKENYWRHLSLEALPRQNIMYDIVEYLKSKSPSTRLRSEMPILMSRPVTQEIQLEQVRAISRLP